MSVPKRLWRRVDLVDTVDDMATDLIGPLPTPSIMSAAMGSRSHLKFPFRTEHPSGELVGLET
jgi:hypothetical protein